MSTVSNYLENKLIEHSLGVSSFTPPTNTYLALFLTDPRDTGSGVEVSLGGYTRQEVTFGSAVDGTVLNTNAVTFSASGAAFGTVAFGGIYDAVSGGNLLFYGSFTPVYVPDGQDFKFAVGDIQIGLA